MGVQKRVAVNYINEAAAHKVKSHINSKIYQRAKSSSGFTLIELLVVIIILAVLAAIAIPVFLGQREKAQNSSALSLVREAAMAAQAIYVGVNDYTSVTASDLQAIEPTIPFVDNGQDLVSVIPPGITATVVADADTNTIAFYVESSTTIDIACQSASGDWYGMQLDATGASNNGHVKVKLIDGSASLGW